MSRFQAQSITPQKLLTVATNILHKAFDDCPRLEAKRRFQAIDEGRTVYLLDVRTEDGGELRINAKLDRSEFRGKLNFSLFRQLARNLVAAQVAALQSDQPLNTFSDEHGQRWVYLIPAACVEDQQVNMMVLAIDAGAPGALTLELMFVDPAQFQRPAAAAG